MTEEEVVSDLLECGLADWVSLQEVVWYGTRGEITSASKSLVLVVLRRLLDKGLMVPGDLGQSGFEDWKPPVALWLERAVAELDRFDWAPMGDGFWLRLTERGRQIAEERP